MKLVFAKGLELPSSAVTQKFAFLGQSGSGKSYASCRLAESMLELGAQIVALDPVGIWWGLRASATGKRAGFPITVFGGDHADIPITPESGELVASVLVTKGVSAVLDVSGFTTAETKRFVRDFAEAFFQAKKKTRGPVHLFFEEAQTFAPQMPERDEGVMLNRIERLLKLGRNYGVGWTLITQQPQAVHKRVLNQAGTVVALRTVGVHERKAIAAWVSDKTHGEAISLLDTLPSLDTGTAHIWSPSFLKVSTTTKIAERDTYDASSTPEFGVESSEPKRLADVDIAELTQAMKSVVDEAQKDDPKALHARIAQLMRQEKAFETKIEQLEREVRLKREAKTVEKPIIAVARAKELKQVWEKALKRLEVVEALSKQLLQELSVAAAERAVTVAPNIIPLRGTPTSQAVPMSAPSDAKIGQGEWKVLTAIAQHSGVTREQLTVLTGYKQSTRNAYLQRLRVAGLVSEKGEQIHATGAGMDVLGPKFQKLPTGKDLLDHWMRELPEGERRILEPLVNAYPGSLERDRLSDLTGYKQSTRNAYLQRLSTRRLIDVSGSSVSASSLLF